MKTFFKMLLAVICAFIIMSIVSVFIFTGLIGAIASFANEDKIVNIQEGILNIDLSKVVVVENGEASESLLDIMKGSDTKSINLWEAIQAIKQASNDPKVKLILLQSDASTTNIAISEELREALLEAKKEGKTIISKIESPSVQSYYMASVADKIYMSNFIGAGPAMFGLSAQLLHVKNLLDALGINMQFIRHGKYKSAGEMYSRNSPSDENVAQTKELITSIWSNIAKESADSRGISIKKYNQLIDNLELSTAEDMLNNNLVDKLVDEDDFTNELVKLAMYESKDELNFINFADYVTANNMNKKVADKSIAVIYADGGIVDGDSDQEVAGDRFAKIISNIRQNDDIKAVVLRVASPGGSVLASDKIKRELDLLKEKKLLIASYGSVAASGGYWISNNANRIFSDRTSITGSIGVFSMIPDVSKALNKFGVNLVTVNSNSHSDIYSLQKLDNAELNYLQKSVDNIYTSFVQNVANGRHLSYEYVDNIAQGRVWSGTDALNNKLIDEIGGLDKAVAYTIASLNEEKDINEWNIVAYPKPLSKIEKIIQMINKNTSANILSNTPFENFFSAFKQAKKYEAKKVYAELPYKIILK